MNPIKPADALKLSIWLAATNPPLFRAISAHIAKLKTNSAVVRMGFFGQDGSTDSGIDITVSAPVIAPVNVSDPSIDTGSLAAIDTSTDLSSIAAPSIDASIADSSQASPSFWSSLGSGVQSVASSIGGVAAALTSPQVLSSVAGAAKTYFQTQAQSTQVQTQAQLAQMQLNRVANGYSPAPVSYIRNPVTGQLQPIYASNTGVSALTGQLYNKLAYPSTGGFSPLLLLGGGIVAVVLLVALTSKR